MFMCRWNGIFISFLRILLRKIAGIIFFWRRMSISNPHPPFKKKIFHHYSHFLFISLSLCSHQSHHVDGYTCIGGYCVLFFKSSSYWKTFFFSLNGTWRKKYVRFSPYSHVCCTHSHIISLPLSQICAFSAYNTGDVVMWSRRH